MSVRAVSAQVTEHRRGLQFYRDADHYDAVGDEFVTGDPTNPNWPDMPLRLKPSTTVGASPSRAGEPA